AILRGVIRPLSSAAGRRVPLTRPCACDRPRLHGLGRLCVDDRPEHVLDALRIASMWPPERIASTAWSCPTGASCGRLSASDAKHPLNSEPPQQFVTRQHGGDV